MNLIILGPVGSGKTTQARLLAKEFGLSLLNVGDLLYFTSREDTPLGKRIKETMDKGGLVEDETTIRLVEEHLKGKEHQAGVVIDGFPRSLAQAKNFKFPLDWVIYLLVSDEVNKKRLLTRGRKDDTEELIEKRLRLYHQKTEPILNYYRKEGRLLEVDGERTIEAIFEDIKRRLKSKNSQ